MPHHGAPHSDYNHVMNLFSALPGHTQLRRLVNLRSLAVAAQAITLLAVWKILQLDLPWLPMIAGIAMLATINLLTFLRLKNSRPVNHLELFAQLCIDIAVLSYLLYYAGGSTNPFISLYLLPLVIAATILPARYTWGIAALTTACYSVLMIYHIPLPRHHQEMDMEMGMDMNNAFDTHVLGMWLGFVISAGVVAYFVVKMAREVRSRDALLVQVREEILRNERIVALGTQAAGAAHELGTPLSTMAVVIGELLNDTSDEELQGSLVLLDEQVRACRRILDKIMLNAQHSGTSGLQAADKLLDEVLDEWQLLRPAAHYRYNGNQPMPVINADVTLRAALMNLLNNAADASPQGIEISTRCNDTHFTVEIRDYGSGLSEDAARQAGSAFFTTKKEGHGVGLFLANATVERMGGTVRLYNREEGGTTTELTLPLATSDEGAAA